ncbi:S26 family signal peptidase [Phenylobacterium sp. LjRoot225]|uniref:S26 family signal peptidase n=1 Tax=Phenylobacterium sp. LjRoot225 TaxID=3342285 RepID=UPI003ECEFA9F
MNPGGVAILTTSLAAACSLALAGIGHLPTRVVYNPTASAPLGFYAVEPAWPLHAGDLVVSHLPTTAAALADRRLYVPASVPVVKTVAAIAAARVCRNGLMVTVDGRAIALARVRDRAGRPLPAWSGCRTLRPGQVLLLSHHPASFDGRYFGPTQTALILGRARPLWTW